MKIASTAELAILSGGKYLRADLYQITLATGASIFLTGFDEPLSVAIATGPSSFGSANTYLTGYTIERGTTTQACGVDAQELELTFYPAWDNQPSGPPLIAGYTIQQAIRLGLMDNASILYSKIFMNYPAANAPLDTSPGGIAWFAGVAAEMDIERSNAVIKVSSNLLILNQVQMPRNLYQSGCTHTLYDSGCAITRASFTSTGAVVGTPTSQSTFNTNLTGKADDYFDLGTIKFTSGLNNGYTATVKLYKSSSGNVSTMIPFPAAIAAGDTFSIVPGCDKLQSTCTTKFSNLIHFKGYPYIPVSETLYDGGTSNPPIAAAPAQQAGGTIGSMIGGNIIGITG